ncbi:hypothetical protein GUJ93_ZPchr0010g9184 [Zizania palustris]|uniref:Uncharacterized protein n=1 Tax=Zizania palustris TaxID=103762 RepID=A0A8J5WDZ1_ZIZPA|nr:hypothetical protein GUJ93_ZPchr0010g9184 [Zizania palustris]
MAVPIVQPVDADPDSPKTAPMTAVPLPSPHEQVEMPQPVSPVQPQPQPPLEVPPEANKEIIVYVRRPKAPKAHSVATSLRLRRSIRLRNRAKGYKQTPMVQKNHAQASSSMPLLPTIKDFIELSSLVLHDFTELDNGLLMGNKTDWLIFNWNVRG